MSTRTIFGSGEFLRGNDRAGGSLDPEAVRVVFTRIAEITDGASEVVATTQGAYGRKISNVQKLQAKDNERREKEDSFNTTPQPDPNSQGPTPLDADVIQRQVDDIHDQLRREG